MSVYLWWVDCDILPDPLLQPLVDHGPAARNLKPQADLLPYTSREPVRLAESPECWRLEFQLDATFADKSCIFETIFSIFADKSFIFETTFSIFADKSCIFVDNFRLYDQNYMKQWNLAGIL